MPSKRFWLFKTEPSEFSIGDLARSGDQTTSWSGIRNYLARNILRDQVKSGDRVFIYHSSVEDKGIAGIGEVVREAYPDLTAQDQTSDYFDPKASKDNPIWCAVDIRLIVQLGEVIPLALLKKTRGLEKMMLCQKGARLSIQPVTPDEWTIICGLAKFKEKK